LNDIPANLDINIENPIVERADDYKMSVIRFTCPLYNVLRYYLSYNNLSVQVTYNTEVYSGTAVPPLSPVDSIYVFVQTINSALFQSWNFLITAYSTIVRQGGWASRTILVKRVNLRFFKVTRGFARFLGNLKG
jgi:hypothetical protein